MFNEHKCYYLIVFILLYSMTQNGIDIDGQTLTFDHIIASFNNDKVKNFAGKLYLNNHELYNNLCISVQK